MSGAALIAAQAQRLTFDFHLSPVTASEIEFYLPGSDSCASLPAFWKDISTACKKAGIPLFKIEKEKGREQHEISLRSCADPAKTARDTRGLKTMVADFAEKHGMTADFSAKPFAGQPGSGLHIHTHLSNDPGRNVFYKDDSRMSDALKFSIGGLLAWLPDCMLIFAQHAASYARFTPGSNAPLTVSWGANNRTTAIRLPDSAHDNKHIEHRVAGSDADPARVMAVILAAIHYGLKNKIDPGAQIFGDAALPQYALARFPTSLEAATERLRVSKMIAEYFSASDLLPDR